MEDETNNAKLMHGNRSLETIAPEDRLKMRPDILAK